MYTSFDVFLGVDEAKDKYDICFVDSKGKVVLEKGNVKHSNSGVLKIVHWLSNSCDSNFNRIAVAIERPAGTLVDTLVERGIKVYSINPLQLDRFRDRYTVAGAKDDRLDAFVLADSLRTDMNCFKKVEIDDPLTVELKEISRLSEELTKEKVRITNRMDEQINRFFPQFFKICPDFDKHWVTELLNLILSDKKIQRNHITKILKKYRVRKVTVDEVMNTINSSFLTLAPGLINGIIFRLKVLVAELQLNQRQRRESNKRVKELLENIKVESRNEEKKLSDAEIILSMPGVGDVIASILLTESSQLISARNYEGLRSISGIAPVTKRSGKKTIICMRRACNRRLRNALYHWARTSKLKDEKCRNYYRELRSRGHGDGRALRSLGDRLLRILVSMLKSNTLYDPNHNNQAVETKVNEDLPVSA